MWGMSGVILDGVRLRLFGYHTTIVAATGKEIITWREYRQVKVFNLLFQTCA